MFGRKLLFAILGLTLWVDSAISETVEVTARSGLKFRSRTTGGVYSVIPRGTRRRRPLAPGRFELHGR
jgi:hypothetical protein